MRRRLLYIGFLAATAPVFMAIGMLALMTVAFGMAPILIGSYAFEIASDHVTVLDRVVDVAAFLAAAISTIAVLIIGIFLTDTAEQWATAAFDLRQGVVIDHWLTMVLLEAALWFAFIYVAEAR